MKGRQIEKGEVKEDGSKKEKKNKVIRQTDIYCHKRLR